MDYSIDIAVKEFDERSSQFACEVTIANTGTAAFEVFAAAPRLPKGLRINEASDTSNVQLGDRQAALCSQLEELVGAFLVAHSQDEAAAYAARIRTAMTSTFTLRSLVDGSLLIRRNSNMFREMRSRLMRLPIANATEGERAVAIMKSSMASPIEIQSAEYVLQSLTDVEDQQRRNSRNRGSLIQPGQNLKQVYVLQARRGLLGVKSYCINFGIELVAPAEESHASRLESASISVSPNPISLTALAVAASAAGTAIRYLVETPVRPTAENLAAQWPSFLVAALTALIVFNIFDLTRLRDQVHTRASWRSAILVGFLCGYLNQRILAAVEALLGTG